MSKPFLYFIAFFLLILNQSNAQKNPEGSYAFPGGEQVIVSGQPSSGYLYLREVINGNVYKLKRINDQHYESDQSFSGIKTSINVYFENPTSIKVEFDNGIVQLGTKKSLKEKFFSFDSGGIKLQAKLVLPEGQGPFPVVVLAHGSGESSAIKNNFYQYLMPAMGIATLVYDKRGTGSSEGIYTQLFEVLSDDMVAAINALEEHKEIDTNKLGIIGFSQGGWVAPLAAAKSDKVKYVVVNYGLAMSIAEEDLLETPMKIASMGFGEQDIKELNILIEAVHQVIKSNFDNGWDKLEKTIELYKNRSWLEATRNTQTWTGTILKMGVEQTKQFGPELLKTFDPYYDPIQTLEKLNISMFWLFAEQDIEAPINLSLERLKTLVNKKKKPIEIKVYPSADHGMYLFSSKENKRYRIKHPDTYLTDITTWLKNQNNIVSDNASDVAIVGANIIAMKDREILEDQVIVIENGLIKHIYPNDGRPLNSKKIIEASGKYIIPGLHDMHVHLETTAFTKAVGLGEQINSFPYEELLTPYIANGITTIQVLSGGEDLLEIRDKIRLGKMSGPNIILGSPMLDGSPPILPEPFTKSISDISQVAPFIDYIKRKNYDFIKTRVGLSKPIFDEIVSNAQRVNIPIIGHIPRGDDLSFEYVISSENFGIAHIEEFGYDNRNPDEKSIKEYISLLKENSGYVITTLSVFDNIIQQMTNFEETVSEEKIKYIHPVFRGVWQNTPFNQYKSSQERLTYFRRQLDYQKMLTKSLYEARIPIMAGTDALNPTIVPGFSIHRELELILDSGLDPYDALRMATVIPAKFIFPDNPFAGTITINQNADMVVLENNPLENLETLKTPLFVILNGEVFDSFQLKEILKNLESLLSDN